MIKQEYFKEYRFDGEKIAQELAKSLNLPYLDLRIIKPEVDALKYITLELAEQAKAIPIKKEKDKILLAVVDPYNQQLLKIKESFKKQGLQINLAIISSESFNVGKEEYKFVQTKRISYIKTFEINYNIFQEVQEKIQKKEELQSLVQNLVKSDPFSILDYILAGALKFNASDVHFEPYENDIFVKYRLDGILYNILTFPKSIYFLLKNRIKVLSGLVINIVDKPQDGSFSISYQDQKIDVRTSFLPSSYDEAIVLRLLNFAVVQVKLENLGLREDDLETLKYAIYQPHGLILNTGPTGSGKTTTLYSILITIKKPEIKIITIENPIEYRIEGIAQSQVDEDRGFTFASALRSILRHDPDVILVGEIKDKETAETAIQASLTGHLVLSTLHTNDSLGAIPRLISLGIDPKLIPPALLVVIAQRLVRRICPYCKEEYLPDENLKNKIKEKLKKLPKKVKINFDLENFYLARGNGCDKCLQTGYKGRVGIFEFLKVTKELEELIYQNPSEIEILNAIEDDFVTLQQDALIKALEKITTIEEIERVTGIF